MISRETGVMVALYAVGLLGMHTFFLVLSLLLYPLLASYFTDLLADTFDDFTHSVGSPIFGWLGDRIRQRRLPMLLGIMASIAANIMFMFACAYWMLLLARFLQGVSNACVWTMSLCLIADNWPERHLGKSRQLKSLYLTFIASGLQMGKLVGFYPLGIVAGLPVGGNVNENMH